jgi:hypothetical protein
MHFNYQILYPPGSPSNHTTYTTYINCYNEGDMDIRNMGNRNGLDFKATIEFLVRRNSRKGKKTCVNFYSTTTNDTDTGVGSPHAQGPPLRN